MKIYIVGNGNYVQGYFLKEPNAEIEKKRINDLTKKLAKEGKNVDTTPCTIAEVETKD